MSTLYARIARSRLRTMRPTGAAGCSRGRVSSIEGGDVVGFKAAEGGIEHFPSRNDHHVKAFTELVTPEDFPGQPFGPIPIDGGTQLARRSHAKTGVRSAVGHDEDRHEAGVNTGPGCVGALEIRAPEDVLLALEPLAARVHPTDHRASAVAGASASACGSLSLRRRLSTVSGRGRAAASARCGHSWSPCGRGSRVPSRADAFSVDRYACPSCVSLPRIRFPCPRSGQRTGTTPGCLADIL